MSSFESKIAKSCALRQEPVRLAAVELLGQVFASLTLETARSRNLAFRTILFAFETRHSVDKRNGWKISSFIKLEIKPTNERRCPKA